MAGYANTSVYLLDEDLDIIKRAAQKKGVKQSALIRDAAVRAAKKILRPSKRAAA